jgi:D-alanyl-lipoteichoic acid acyltransferase DltB (MBOAT superfamily)
MLFNSVEFLVFYLIVVAAYFALPAKRRWMLLLASSYWFYMSWEPRYALLLLFCTLANFLSGIAIENATSPRARRVGLVVGVTASLSLLAGFKYLDFLSENVEAALRALSLQVNLPIFDILLPVGISFYTFQAVGYTVDVYRRRVPAERHFGIFALYVSFFPQLVAGPIERSSNLLPQFREVKRFDPADVTFGLRQILWGLFKKVVIADQAAVVVDKVYADPGIFSGPYLLFATAVFAVQIYCDFSGYSDMAIGTARIMGFRLMENFRRPYFATSIGEFWRRWHISLMSWLRDYVYVSMGGFQRSRLLAARGVLVVFLLSGIWHGASWTFVIWGLLHGIASVAGTFTASARRRFVRAIRLDRVRALHVALQRLSVLTIVVLTFVFFRSQTLGEAVGIFERLFDWQGAAWGTLWTLGLPRFEMMVLLLGMAFLFAAEWAEERKPAWIEAWWSRRPLRWAFYTAGVYAVGCLGVFGRVEFIYFQF